MAAEVRRQTRPPDVEARFSPPYFGGCKSQIPGGREEPLSRLRRAFTLPRKRALI